MSKKWKVDGNRSRYTALSNFVYNSLHNPKTNLLPTSPKIMPGLPVGVINTEYFTGAAFFYDDSKGTPKRENLPRKWDFYSTGFSTNFSAPVLFRKEKSSFELCDLNKNLEKYCRELDKKGFVLPNNLNLCSMPETFTDFFDLFFHKIQNIDSLPKDYDRIDKPFLSKFVVDGATRCYDKIDELKNKGSSFDNVSLVFGPIKYESELGLDYIMDFSFNRGRVSLNNIKISSHAHRIKDFGVLDNLPNDGKVVLAPSFYGMTRKKGYPRIKNLRISVPNKLVDDEDSVLGDHIFSFDYDLAVTQLSVIKGSEGDKNECFFLPSRNSDDGSIGTFGISRLKIMEDLAFYLRNSDPKLPKIEIPESVSEEAELTKS